MSNFTKCGNLSVDANCYAFVNEEWLQGATITPTAFWEGFDQAVHQLAPRNQELLAIRHAMQEQIDQWLIANAKDGIDPTAYEAFLTDIGYLIEDGDDFAIETKNVDVEIAQIAGPELVVPIANARYALNAANARFGSLYDALYGTDVIPLEGATAPGNGYNEVRGEQVIAYVRGVLDDSVPLANASWRDVTGLAVNGGKLVVTCGDSETGLDNADVFAGHTGEAGQPEKMILRHNGLHFLIIINRSGAIGKHDPAGITDVEGAHGIS